MSPLKILLLVIILVPVLLVGTVLVLIANPDYYREPLTNTFEEEIGLRLTIKGGISWRYWPPIALSFADAEIRPRGSATPLAEVREVAVDMDLWPLLFGGQLAIHGITIDGLTINLLVDDTGKGNWEVEHTAAPEPSPADSTATREEEPPDEGSSLGLDIREVEVRDVRIHYVDASSQSDLLVTLDSLRTGALRYDEPTATRFTMNAADQISGFATSVEGNGAITFSEGFSHFAFTALETREHLSVPDIPAIDLALTLNGEVDLDEGALHSDISGQVDGATLLGKAALTLGERPDVGFDFTFERLDANRYLGGDENQPPAEEATASHAAPLQDSEVIPVEALRGIDFTGKLRVRSLLVDTHKLADVAVDLDNRHGQFRTVTSAKAYGGDVAVILNLSTGDRVVGTTDVDAESLDLAQFMGLDWITGKGSLESQTRFSGTMLSEILSSLDGTTRFTITDGTLDVSAIKEIAATVDSLRGKPSAVSQWPDRMPVEQMQGEHSFSNGIGANQRLSARLPNLSLTGTGGIDYFGNHLAYDFKAKLIDTNEGPFQVNADLARIGWPLHCEGPLDASPADLCKPDREAVRDLITGAVKEEVKNKAKERVLEKLPDSVKDAAEKLKNLFNR